MDALIRRRMMMMEGGIPPTPPTPPTPVEGAYIRNTSLGAYIDTGITPDDSTKVIIWARNFNPTCGFLFGSRTSFGVDSLGIGTHSAEETGRIRVDYAQTHNTYYNNAFQYLSNYHKYELYNGVLKVDDITLATATQDTFSNSYNIHLFGINNGGSRMDAVLPIDICAAQIYKSGVLVRDFSAVNTPSVGLYDAVTNTLFTNAGSGSFTYGVLDANAYTALDYITTSGNSYFITDVIGTYSLPIVVKFKATATTAAWFDVIGGRDASNRCQIFTGNASISNARLYGILGTASASTIYNSNSAGAVGNKELIVIKSNNKFSAVYNNAAFGSTKTYSVASTYSTGVPIGVGATWNEYEQNPFWGNMFIGNIYYVGFGSQCNLVPVKVNGVAGMYDTYNDVFYSSISGTDFTAGNEI